MVKETVSTLRVKKSQLSSAISRGEQFIFALENLEDDFSEEQKRVNRVLQQLKNEREETISEIKRKNSRQYRILQEVQRKKRNGYV